MSGLPKGWVSCSMRDIARLVGGGTPPASDPTNFSPDGYPWITPADLSGYRSMYIGGGKRFLSEKGLKGSSAVLMPKGTVLFTSRAPIGYVAIADREIATNQGFRSFVCEDGIWPEYVYFYMKTMKPLAEQMASGTTFLEISGTKAGELPIVIPPFNEQKRIAAKLEVLLSKADGCRERLDTIPVILRRFRQSVLSAACLGNLTASWRAENSGQEWTTKTLAEMIVDKPKNGYSAQPVRYETPYKVLSLTATTSGVFDGRHYKFFDEAIPEDSPCWLQPGDILIQRGNTIEYVGVPAVYTGDPKAFIYPDLMMRIRAKEGIDTQFLYFALSWEESRNFLRERATGTAGNMPKINQPTLCSLPIPLPPFEEQQEIVRRVAALFKVADGIEARYNKARIHTDRLTQSILAKAFRGELVPQDPNDEPAEKLLERIWAERTPSIMNPTSKRRAKDQPAVDVLNF